MLSDNTLTPLTQAYEVAVASVPCVPGKLLNFWSLDTHVFQRSIRLPSKKWTVSPSTVQEMDGESKKWTVRNTMDGESTVGHGEY